MELLDIYDKDGKITGRTIVRGDKNEILNDDEHIALSVIFIENSNGEFLIQKTSNEKGGEFSSTGGHVNSGETPLYAVVREVQEELGVSIKSDEIEEYGFLSYDKPLRYIYYIKKDIDLNDIKLQKEEVEYVKYMSVSDIYKLISTNKMLKSHGIMFNYLMKMRNPIKEDVKDYVGERLYIKIDRPFGSKHPKHGFIYPINYGYVPNTISDDGEELDAYLLGIFEPVDEYTGKCIAIIHRTNDDDDKLIVVPFDKTYSDDAIEALVEFQEEHFKHVLMRK